MHRRPLLAVVLLFALFLVPLPAGAATTEVTYTVVRGDTLSAIGARHGVPWQAIAERNGLANPDLIHPGEVFIIPEPTLAPAPAPAPPSDPSPAAAPAEYDDSIEGIIIAAARRYGQDPGAMLRVAWCESNYDPNAYNSEYGATGLFQFLASTWQTTPYRDYDRRNAWASANAAAWMWSVGRRGEWVCRG